MAVPTGDSAIPDLARPRTPRGSDGRLGSAAERYRWWFVRLSGLVLIVLVLGHLFVMDVLDGGVQRVNFAFIAGRWSSPYWRTWDLAMLWLGEIHGTIGLRTVISDYARHDRSRRWLTAVLYTAAVLIVALGTYVIVTFNPNLTSN